MLWDKYPQFYNKHNTIMFDDLRRNYVMNRQNGLVIRPFRKARPQLALHVVLSVTRRRLHVCLKAFVLQACIDTLAHECS